MYLDGLFVADEGGIVMGMAALYHACQQTGLLKKGWKDMDAFIELIGSSNLGLRPAVLKPFESCAKQFGLAMGVELAAYSKERRDRHGVSPRAPLPSKTRMEQRRLRIPEQSVYTTATSAQVRLEDTEPQAEIANLFELAANVLNNPHSKVDDGVRARWQKCRKLTDIELLEVLKKTLQTDERHMSFDYHHLFYICATSLIKLKNDDHVPINRITGGSSSIISFVDDVLWEAVDGERLQPGSAKKGSSLAFIAKLLDKLFCTGPNGSTITKDSRNLLDVQRGKDRSRPRREVPGEDPRSTELLKAHLSLAEKTSQGAAISVAGSQVDYTPAMPTGADESYRKKLLEVMKECSVKLTAGTLTKEDLTKAFFPVDELELKDAKTDLVKEHLEAALEDA